MATEWLANVLSRPVSENIAELRGTVEHLLEEAAAAAGLAPLADANGQLETAAAPGLPKDPPLAVHVAAAPAIEDAADAAPAIASPLAARATAAEQPPPAPAPAPAPILALPIDGSKATEDGSSGRGKDPHGLVAAAHALARAWASVPALARGPPAAHAVYEHAVALAARDPASLDSEGGAAVLATLVDSLAALLPTVVRTVDAALASEGAATAGTGPGETARERRLQQEVERLQNHILAREEAFTQEVLQQDEQLRALQAELDALRAAAATGAPVSASGATAAAAEASAAVGAADGGATASEAPADQRSDAQALANLQAVIEMLQTESHVQLRATTEAYERRLQEANAALQDARAQLAAAEAQLQALQELAGQTTTLQAQLEAAQKESARLRREVERHREHLQESMHRLNESYASADSASVDRRLMCNLVTAYASERDAHKRTEILRVIADILGASDADKQAMGLLRPHGVATGGGGGLLGSLLFGGAAPPPRVQRDPTKNPPPEGEEALSFSELWVQFLLNAAKPSDDPSAASAKPRAAV